jgi:tetratricopeptide (TPR) repeat protein
MRTLRSPLWCLPAILFVAAARLPDNSLEKAKQSTSVAEQISLLRQCLRESPQDPRAQIARDNLVTLLTLNNRYEEALQEQRLKLDLRKPSGAPDLQLLELLLKTGRYSEVLTLTAKVTSSERNLLLDQRLLEARVQALLAQGRYREARESVDPWLGLYGRQGEENSRYALEVKNVQQLRTYLAIIERTQGASGKPLFTVSVPDSLVHWSRRRRVPVVFFKLVPTNPGIQTASKTVEEFKSEEAFRKLIEDANRGFRYISGNTFTLAFKELHTLYINTDDLEPAGSHANLLNSRVYIHTLPPLYKQAGRAFVVLVDYRAESDEEAAYMGDGLIHIAANKLHSLTLMHEVLHGLGATHQDWSALTPQGYRFNPEDRGLMTFEKGLLRNLGLEEKNRILVDWPAVPDIPLSGESVDLASLALPLKVPGALPELGLR